MATRVEGSATAWATSVGVSKYGDPGVQETGENHGLVRDQSRRLKSVFVAGGALEEIVGRDCCMRPGLQS